MELVNLKQSSRGLISKCAELYCEIWKEPPWNEDFWKPEDVRQDLEQQLKKDCAQGFLSVHNQAVVGFTWAYAVTDKEVTAICGSTKLEFLFQKSDLVFYVDELAVSPNYRRQKVGENLTIALMAELKKYGSSLIILRTDKKAQAARLLYQKIGFKDLLVEDKQYPDRTYWVFGF